MFARRRVFLLSILLAFFLCSCSVGEQPGQAVEKTVSALKAADGQTAQKYVDYQNLLAFSMNPGGKFSQDGENVKLLFSKLSCKINSTKVEGDNAVVNADITTIDMQKIFLNYMSQSLSLINSTGQEQNQDSSALQTQLAQIFTELLKKQDTKTVTTNVDIHLVKSQGNWTITLDENFQDAVLGGVVKAVRLINESMNAQPPD